MLSKLRKNKYEPLKNVKSKVLRKMLDDPNFQYYVKIVEKVLDYSDKNDDIIFSSHFKFALVAVMDKDELIDSFATPLIPFCVRTEQDSNALNEIFEELRNDFDDEYVDGDA